MQLTHVLPVLFTTLAFASPLPETAAGILEVRAAKAPDNAKLVVKDVAAILADLIALNKTLNTFEPDAPLGLVTAMQIQTETNTIEAAINKTIADTNASAKWGDKDSYNVALAQYSLVSPTKSVLANIVKHKPAFSSVLVVLDLSKTVEQSLITQRGLTKTLGAATAKKLGSPYNTFAPGVTKNLVQTFNKAIAAYKACTGAVCLPPTGGSPTLPPLPIPSA